MLCIQSGTPNAELSIAKNKKKIIGDFLKNLLIKLLEEHRLGSYRNSTSEWILISGSCRKDSARVSKSPACPPLLPSAQWLCSLLDKKLMGREMLSMKGPKQMFSENEEIVLEQRPTVQVNRARAFRSMLYLLL